MSLNDRQRPFISMVSLALISLSLLVCLLVALGILLDLFPGINRLTIFGPVFLVAVLINAVGFLLNFKPIQAVLPVLPFETQDNLSSWVQRTSTVEPAMYWLFFVGAVIAFCAGKALIYSYSLTLYFPDTIGYVRVAEAPVFSSAFLVAERPPTYPLFLKVLGVTLENFKTEIALSRVARAQTTLSGLSWILLAVVVARLIRQRWFRPYFFSLLLGAGLTLHISQWDALALTESVTTSLLVIGVSLALLLLQESSNQAPPALRVVLSLLFIIVVVLYGFSRDENAIFLLVIGFTILLTSVLNIRRLGLWNGWLAAALLFIVVSSVSQALIVKSERWFPPFVGMFQQRILADPAARESFHKMGMPQGEWMSAELIQTPRTDFYAETQSTPAAAPFLDWMRAQGRSAYFQYLLSDPLEFLGQPLEQARSLLSPLSLEYRGDSAVEPLWLVWLTRLVYPRPLPVVFGWLTVAVVAFGWLYRAEPIPSRWWLPAMFVLSTPVMMLAIWYADTIEVERHAYQIGLRLRLALWLATLWLLDRVFGRYYADPARALITGRGK